MLPRLPNEVGGLRLRLTHPMAPVLASTYPAALIPDRAEMLVDAEDDQDQFRGNAREHDPDDDARDRLQHHQEAGDRTDRHRGEACEDAGEAEQADHGDHQPVEGLNDGRRDEAVPLKQVAEENHPPPPGQTAPPAASIWLKPN